MIRTRWLGRVPYGEADQLQRALHARAGDDYLLLPEHPHVYTLGTTADPRTLLVSPGACRRDLVYADRGGDVTYHGPGTACGLPDHHRLPEWAPTACATSSLTSARPRRNADSTRSPMLGGGAPRTQAHGVWVGNEKIAAIGVKVAHGRTRHGFALNVAPTSPCSGHIGA